MNTANMGEILDAHRESIDNTSGMWTNVLWWIRLLTVTAVAAVLLFVIIKIIRMLIVIVPVAVAVATR